MTTTRIQTLARRLIALESARNPSDGLVGATVRVLDRLRVPLAKLAGVAGYRSLLTRARALATVEAPGLTLVQVRVDGMLEGLDAIGVQHSVAHAGEAAVAILIQLLGLLATFIGEPLTLQLVRDAWPDASVTGMDAGGES